MLYRYVCNISKVPFLAAYERKKQQSVTLKDQKHHTHLKFRLDASVLKACLPESLLIQGRKFCYYVQQTSFSM